jgi:predicted DNA-binding transcriptional regulator AlpA
VEVIASIDTNPDTPLDAPKWLTPAQAAEFLGMSTSWINQARMKSKAGGPPYRKIGGRVAYLREDLLQYIENQKVTPEAK